MLCRWLNVRLHLSPRSEFQWHYVLRAELPVLNIGSGEDPQGFAEYAVHVDLLPQPHLVYFAQADAYRLPFADERFDTVVMGDIIEHLEHPRRAIEEAARVCRRRLVMSVFHETRLPLGYSTPREDWSGHCWNFDERMMRELTALPGWGITRFDYAPELKHEGQLYYDWLIAAERVKN